MKETFLLLPVCQSQEDSGSFMGDMSIPVVICALHIGRGDFPEGWENDRQTGDYGVQALPSEFRKI